MVKYHKYPIIQYKVTTKDGYILTLFRIPASKDSSITQSLKEATKKKSVLMVHGILSDTVSFIINGPEKPNKAIAYQLVDEGNYDVWLLNTRGSIYSREHSWMDPDSDEQFWNYSFEEVGDYDIMAAMDFIKLKKPNEEKIDFVSYS